MTGASLARRSVPPAWELRALETAGEMAAVERLQRIVWPGSDLDIVPAHVLLTAAHNGGMVAGAFVGDELAGFAWGFLGYDERGDLPRLKHCSHQLGVRPDYRSAGIGFALKCFQRQHVLRQGLDLITWTYDPLLARNARLNIAKLGAVCCTYCRELYGEMQDSLNAGLPSDRFQVDWWVASERVAARIDRAAPPPTFAARLAGGALTLNAPAGSGLPQPDFDLSDAPDADAVLLEIPHDFLARKAADPALALRWRLATRAACETLFGWGFAVTDFVFQPGPPRAAYVLTHPGQGRVLTG